jgi:hypothetical protein
MSDGFAWSGVGFIAGVIVTTLFYFMFVALFAFYKTFLANKEAEETSLSLDALKKELNLNEKEKENGGGKEKIDGDKD